MKKKKLPKLNLDDWGTPEEGSPPHKNKTSLVPIGKDGEEIEWYGRSWAGVIEYAKSLGLKYTDLGALVESTYGNKATFKQIMFAQQVHKSLSLVPYYRREREKMAPSGIESDMHYAIRMDQKAILKLYRLAGGKPKDEFKGAAAMYARVYKTRKSFVEAYLFTEKLTKKRMKEVAEIRSKALGTDKLFKKLSKVDAALKKKQKK